MDSDTLLAEEDLVKPDPASLRSKECMGRGGLGDTLVSHVYPPRGQLGDVSSSLQTARLHKCHTPSINFLVFYQVVYCTVH